MKKTICVTMNRQTDNFHEESFVVPHALNTIYIKVNLPEECRYMSFLFLQDETGAVRLQKLLGYGEQNLAVGNDGEHTSIGGVAGHIGPGEWKLGIGIFTEYVCQRLGEKEAVLQITLTDEAGEITEPIGNWTWMGEGLRISPEKYHWDKQYQIGAKWYKGDFHTHTRLSDGKETVKNAMKKAKDMEMDFYVPTEHNLMHTGWCDTELCILPGIEITTDMGHFNLFGITEMPEKLLELVRYNGKPQMEQYVEETIQEANRKGWIVSLNHPFLTIWKWQYGKTALTDFQCVEIINDPTYQDAPASNDKAIRFLDALWEDGHRIWGVGGSDAHNLIEERYEGADLPSIAGDPGTYVFCENLSPKALMEQVKKGHMCVTRFCRILPEIIIDGKEYLPGEEFSVSEQEESTQVPQGTKDSGTEENVQVLQETEILYGAEISGLEEEPEVFVVKNGQRYLAKVFVNEAGNYCIREQVRPDRQEWNWVRLEVRKKNGDFLGYVNPVFCGHPKSHCKTVEELWKLMGEQ